MFIDTHCHISSEYYDDIDKIIKENISNDVNIMIVSGCDKKGIVESLELIKKYNCIYCSIGFHPSEVGNVTDEDLSRLENQIVSNDKVVALGEIGLDYYYGNNDKEEQKQLFIKQLKIAEKLNIPVVIHSRDAVKDTIDILSKFHLRGVVHCFSGSLEIAREYIKLGYLLGIGGVITFKNSNLYKVVESIDIKNIVLETDSPYLSPEPFRGKINSSKNIPIIAKKVADIKKCDVSKVATGTTNNSVNLFDLSF